MKKKIQFVYPAIFVKLEDETYQAIFPDLDIYTDGATLAKAYLCAKELLTVYFAYAVKYDTDFNAPSKFEALASRCKENEIVMLIDAVVEE